jgi:hypothetical protein
LQMIRRDERKQSDSLSGPCWHFNDTVRPWACIERALEFLKVDILLRVDVRIGEVDGEAINIDAHRSKACMPFSSAQTLALALEDDT